MSVFCLVYLHEFFVIKRRSTTERIFLCHKYSVPVSHVLQKLCKHCVFKLQVILNNIVCICFSFGGVTFVIVIEKQLSTGEF